MGVRSPSEQDLGKKPPVEGVSKLKIPFKLPWNGVAGNVFIPQVYMPGEAGNYLERDCVLQNLLREAGSCTPT